MGDVRIKSPRLTVIREGHDALTLQTNNMDMVLWDRTRIKHRWPRMDEAPFLWFTFISWSAARRTGAIADSMTYESWEREVLDVSAEDEPDEDPELGAPFLAGPDPGSS